MDTCFGKHIFLVLKSMWERLYPDRLTDRRDLNYLQSPSTYGPPALSPRDVKKFPS